MIPYRRFMKKFSEENFLNLLLSGRHPKAKKYAGHHVLVIKDQIVPFFDLDLGFINT